MSFTSSIKEPLEVKEKNSYGIYKSEEYKQAIAIIKRSGLRPENWGFLLHDITRALLGEKFFVEK